MDFRASTIRSLENACSIFLQDLQALPEDAFCKNLGGKARTVADIVHEVNLVNDHIGMVIRGEEPFVWPDGWITAPAELNSKASVVDAFKASSERIVATAKGFSDDEFFAPFMTDEGEKTRFERCRFMTIHLWYHSGQLNFIQTLLGDDGWHWQ